MGAASKKRRVGTSASSRGRKKHKSLDAITDRPIPFSPPDALSIHDSDQPPPRRSSRVRRAPVVLDSSPVRSHKRTPKHGASPVVQAVVISEESKKIRKRKKKGGKGKEEIIQSARRVLDLTEVGGRSRDQEGRLLEVRGEWSSRLRSSTVSMKSDGAISAGARCGKSVDAEAEIDPKPDVNPSQVLSDEQDGLLKPLPPEEPEKSLESPVRQASGSTPLISGLRKRKKSKKKKTKKKNKKAIQMQVKDTEEKVQSHMIDDDKDDSKKTELEKIYKETYINGNAAPPSLSNTVSDNATAAERTFDQEASQADLADEIAENYIVGACLEESRSLKHHSVEENPKHSHQESIESSPLRKKPVTCARDADRLEAPTSTKEAKLKLSTSRDLLDQTDVGEGRRCGLCGRGDDGKLPKRLLQEWADSENEVYHRSAGFEEPKYNELDGFGDEPEWLGQLLGPIRDRLGIARVWVHQQCAVWSPEVYFAGVGCLKSVRAALSRGRALKCCRCERPGATIGCRVDRCPKNYHLPCARADNCVFDHRKFLMACRDHRHLFQPQGRLYAMHLKKLKAKKRKLDIKKKMNEAYRKDIEAEERWLENCGEDEEFLKRESRRLHRDLLRIAPVYIGGPNETKPSYQGWESVAGLQDVIQCMKEVVILPLLYPEFFSSLGLTPPRGVLLHGYPGTGKTLVVRSLIGECSRGNKRIAYFARKGADCLGKYVGDAERQLRLLFQVAEKSQPSIIFFDEIDGLAPCRSKRQDQTHSSVVSTLLSLLDGLKSRGSVIVIGATNRPEALDPALRRPGRFDREIYFPLPSVNDRSAILSLHTKSWPKPLCEPLVSWIAKQTVDYAGADLQALCTQAAIIALKRNCPLQKILCSAEKGFDVGERPLLPSFVVEERDWIAALVRAPPPCARREAGAAVDDVVSSPLPFHLLPNFVQPLSQLLVSFHLEERLSLPTMLSMAGKHIKNALFSALDQENIPHLCWISHLKRLVQDPGIATEIEKTLIHCGLLAGLSFGYQHIPKEVDNGHLADYSHTAGLGDSSHESYIKRWKKSSGFRVLVSGGPSSGQGHLASCLLQGFVGNIAIQKISLTTISQEGDGDLDRGVTQILLKCLSLQQSVLFMPRVDLWAIDPTAKSVRDEKDMSIEMMNSDNISLDTTQKSSQAWDSFVQQVNSVCNSSLIVVGTSEVQINDLPHRVRDFFSQRTLKNNASTECSIPRFSVRLDEETDHKPLIVRYAKRLSQDLVQQYIQKVHIRRSSKSHGGTEVHCIPEGDLQGVTDNPELTNDATELICKQANSTTRSFAGTAAAKEPTLNVNNGDIQQSFSTRERQHEIQQKSGHEVVDGHGNWNHITCNKFSTKGVLKGNLMLAISSFGYQVLRFPHFAELCWITSKLREGPVAEITGPLKFWPFNSCVLQANNSSDKIVAGSNVKFLKDKKNPGVVRGLVAVGLLAYRGVYTSALQVSSEVRKVSELLVQEIDKKVSKGKDRLFFLRVLSQVAYLEDMIDSWAYTLQRSHLESPSAGSSHQTNQYPSDLADDVEGHGGGEDISKTSLEGKIEAPHKQGGLAGNNELSVNQSNLVSEINVAQCHTSGLNSSSPSGSVIEEPCNGIIQGNGTCTEKSAEVFNGLEKTEASHPLDSTIQNTNKGLSRQDCGAGGAYCCTSPCACNSAPLGNLDPDELVKETPDCISNQNSHGSRNSDFQCAYECCVECMQLLNNIIQNILTENCKSKRCLSAVDKVNDVISSHSASILTASMTAWGSRPTDISKEDTPNEKHIDNCSCQIVDDVLLTNRTSQILTSCQRHLLLAECSCHLSGADATTTSNESSITQLNSTLKIFLKNDTVVPSNHFHDNQLHCNFYKLCLCPVINAVLAVTQTRS